VDALEQRRRDSRTRIFEQDVDRPMEYYELPGPWWQDDRAYNEQDLAQLSTQWFLLVMEYDQGDPAQAVDAPWRESE